ncbi:MAG: TonB-dependent receptor [Bacteroidota bacterium]
MYLPLPPLRRAAGLLLGCLLLPLVAVAQNQSISGTVTDAETGGPLPGVNVFAKGTTAGGATDLDGRYAIQVPASADTLVFSFVGYIAQEVAIQGRTVIDVVMAPDVERLNEVLVVGYGTQQRARISGSISSIDVEKLEEIPITSFEGGIQGQLPGVVVQEPTGEPGATPTIRVRGTGSITAGNEPLYVIDGFPVARDVDLQGNLFRRRAAFRPPPSNPLAGLNPGDIQSIEILKDASSAAIYGSRGSNGVVLITTKKGRPDGRATIRYDAYIGTQTVANTPDMMNAQELITYTQDARNNNYLQKFDPLNPNSPNFNPNYDPTTNAGRPDDGNVLIPEAYVNWDGTDTDWLGQIFDSAPVASSNLSVSGGSGSTTYYLSGGYLNQEGIISGSGFERFSGRVNLATNPLNWLTVGVNLSSAFTQQDRLPAGSPYFARPPGIVYSALVHSPVVAPFNDDGTPNQLNNQSYLGGGTTSASNPLAIQDGVEEALDSHRTFGNLYGEAELLPGLRYRAYFGADLLDYTRSFYRASTLLYRTARQGETYAQSSSSRSFNWVLENTLSYDREFTDEHAFSGVVGYTAQKEVIDVNDIIAQNFPDDEVRTISGGQVTDGTSFREEWALVSFLARANYSFRDRYLLTATIRTDRSSRFGADNQTGVFPSVSAGWRLSEEAFMQETPFNNLLLRASYGVTGNFLIPNYGSIALLTQGNYILSDGVASGVVPTTLGNQELTWETTRQFNVGLDVALLQDRFYFTAEFYNSITSDLLLDVNIPAALGFTTALTNIGEVRNRGFEFSITSRNIVGGDFEWSTDFNISTNTNEVLELGTEGDPILSAGGAGLRHITRVGDAIGSYYGWVVDGIYQDEQDIANSPADALAPDPQPGDFKFKDINGDGIINADDRTVTGNYFPDYTFGINNTFSYRGVDLQVFIQGVQGNEILNLTSRHLKNGEANFNSYAVFNDRWRSPEDPGNGDVPRADRQSALHGNNNRQSDFQVEDGSYIRLRTLTLGYTLDQGLFQGRLQRARVYLTGTNLFTSTDYLGFNPEVSNQSQVSTTPGEDYGAYPLARTWTLGVNLTF